MNKRFLVSGMIAVVSVTILAVIWTTSERGVARLADGTVASQVGSTSPPKPEIRTPGPPISQTAADGRQRSPLFVQFSESADLFDFFKYSSALGTAEGYYLASRAAGSCLPVVAKPYSQMRSEFIDKRLGGDSNQVARLRAFDALWRRCAAFEAMGPALVNEQVAMLEKAAQLNEPRGLAELALHNKLRGRSEESTRVAAALVTTHGPSLPGEAVEVLASIGEQRPDLPSRLAWWLVACDLGAECGRTSRRVLEACAIDGDCFLQTTEDLVAGHLLTPMQFQQANVERARLHTAIRNRDPVALGFSAASVRPGTPQRVKNS